MYIDITCSTNVDKLNPFEKFHALHNMPKLRSSLKKISILNLHTKIIIQLNV